MDNELERRRKNLAHFLKTRRMRLTPEEYGLPVDAQRRRTPGLRREEVAVLAGISLPWYTSLEQGRDIRVSEQILESLVRVLKLNADERNHLYTLALQQLPLTAHPAAARPEGLSAEHLQLIRQLEPYPAFIHDIRWNILAWNRMSTLVFGDFGTMKEEDRNMLLMLYTNKRFREILVEWEPIARNVLAQFRIAISRHAEDSWNCGMIRRLSDESEEFRDWWDQHEVQSYTSSGSTIVHPQVGTLALKSASFAMVENPDLVMKVLCPVEESDALEKLNKLHRELDRSQIEVVALNDFGLTIF